MMPPMPSVIGSAWRSSMVKVCWLPSKPVRVKTTGAGMVAVGWGRAVAVAGTAVGGSVGAKVGSAVTAVWQAARIKINPSAARISG